MVGNGHEPPRRFHGDAGRAYRRVGPEVNEDRSRKGMVEAREGFGAHERRRNDGWRQEDVKRARRWPANESSEDKYGRGGSHEMEKQKDGRHEERHVQKFHGRAERNWMNDEAAIAKERKSDDRMDAKHDRRGERVRGFVESERRPDGSQDGKGVRKFRGEERYAGSERERRHHDEKWVRDDRGTADCEKGRSEKPHGDRHPGKESGVVARPVTDNRRESRGGVHEPVEERSEARCEKSSREERHVHGQKNVSDLVDDNSKVDRHSESCREDLAKDNDQDRNVGGKPEPQQQGDTGGVDSAEEKGKDNVVGTNEDKVLRDSEAASADIELLTGMDIPVQKMRRDDDETFWGADVDPSFPVSPQVRRQDSPHVSAGDEERRSSIPGDQAEDDKNCDTSRNQDLDLVHDQDAEIDHDYNQDCHELDHDQDRDWDRDRGHSQERDPDHMWDRGRGHGCERDPSCDRDDDPGRKRDGDRDLTPDGDLDVDRTGDDGPLWESERLRKEAERISPSPQKEDKRSFSEDDIDWKTDGRDKTESKTLSDADHERKNDGGQEEEERPTKGESGRRQMVLVDDEPGRHLQRRKRPREESESPANDRENQAGHGQAENCQVDEDCDLTVDRGKKAGYQDLSEKPTGVTSDPVKRDPSEEGVCGRNDRAGPGPGDRSPTSTRDLTLEAERARTADAPLLSVEGSRKCRSRSSTPPTKEYRDGAPASREPRLASDVVKDEQEVGGSRRSHGGHDSRDRKVPHEPREGEERGDERDAHNGRDNRDERSIRDGGRDGRYGRDERDGRNGRDEQDGRNGREGRDGRGVRDGREMRDVRDPAWSARHTRDVRDTRGAPVRNMRDGRDGKDGWQSRAGSGRDFGGRSGSMGGRRGRRPSLSPPRARRRIRSRSPPHNNQPGGRKRSPWRPKSPVRRSPPPFRRSPGRQLSPQRARVTGVGKPGNNLFVAGFNYITSERDLERKFSRFGRVTNVRIVRDNSRTQESRGFGFVTLERDENADEAIKALDGTNWNGRVVLVEKAKSAPRR